MFARQSALAQRTKGCSGHSDDKEDDGGGDDDGGDDDGSDVDGDDGGDDGVGQCDVCEGERGRGNL